MHWRTGAPPLSHVNIIEGGISCTQQIHVKFLYIYCMTAAFYAVSLQQPLFPSLPSPFSTSLPPCRQRELLERWRHTFHKAIDANRDGTADVREFADFLDPSGEYVSVNERVTGRVV